jgi:hypothetical protein
MEFRWDREHNKGLSLQFNNLMANIYELATHRMFLAVQTAK